MQWVRSALCAALGAWPSLSGSRPPAPPAPALQLGCDELTPDKCGYAGSMLSRGKASRVCVDCLVFDEAGMDRLQTAVPLSKIEMDFTELFAVPDLVSDSDDM